MLPFDVDRLSVILVANNHPPTAVRLSEHLATILCYYLSDNHHRRRLTVCVLTLLQESPESNYVARMQAIRQIKTVFVIFIAFVCCWSPYIVVLLYDHSDGLPLPVHLYSSMIAHLHASLNFAIYGLMNRNLCPGSAAHILRCCNRVTQSNVGSSGCYVQRTPEDGDAHNRRVYTSRKLVVIEYHQLQDVDRCG